MVFTVTQSAFYNAPFLKGLVLLTTSETQGPLCMNSLQQNFTNC